VCTYCGFALFFYFIFVFFIFRFSFSETGQQIKTRRGGKNDPYLERIEARLHCDPLRGFGDRGILPHLSSTASVVTVSHWLRLVGFGWVLGEKLQFCSVSVF